MYLQIRNFGYDQTMRSQLHEGKHNYENHIHQFLEVMCVLEGSLEVSLNGNRQTANAGDFAVILPFHSHSFHTPEYCKVWVGVFSTDWVHDFIPQDSFTTVESAVFTPSEVTFRYVVEKMPPPCKYRKGKIMLDEKVRTIKALLYAILSEFFPQVKSTTTVLHISALSALYTYIYQHYTEPITIKQAANDLGYTSTYLSHCLSAIPGTNFRSIVNGARIEHAKKLLIKTEKRIIEIAFESGYASESVFYSAFERVMGVTPYQYRAEQKKANIGKYTTLLP